MKVVKKLNATISAKELTSDVLERLDGMECMSNNVINNTNDHDIKSFVIYRIKRMLNDKEDDTNETTKNRIAELYEAIKDCEILTIHYDL